MISSDNLIYLNAIFLPGLAPENEDRDAWEEAPDEATEESGLVEIIGIPADQAGITKGTAAAYK